MGVYIKGMEMPDSCDVCKFSDWSNLHQTACCKILEYEPCFNDFSSEYKTRISDLCPLVEVPEPHGRLIDVNDVKGRMIPLSFSVQKWIDEVELSNCNTVIEAEGSNDTRKAKGD